MISVIDWIRVNGSTTNPGGKAKLEEINSKVHNETTNDAIVVSTKWLVPGKKSEKEHDLKAKSAKERRCGTQKSPSHCELATRPCALTRVRTKERMRRIKNNPTTTNNKKQ